MSTGYTQARRSLSVTSDLGRDVLLLQGFSGTEALSRLFQYRLDLASEREGISPKDVVGKGLTWSVRQIDSEPRHFHGLVSRFVAGPRGDRGLFTYRVEVVPWLWFLARTTDCRIFQNKTAPQIIEEVFDAFGFRDYEPSLKGTYARREYCVQYRETVFDFVSRLMEHEGIFYFFRHEEGKHTLVMGDLKTAYTDCAESQVRYSRGSLAPNHLDSWEHGYEFRSGKWAQTDYNFETPSTGLLTATGTVVDQPGQDRFELYDYPGDYYVKGDGEPVTKVRIEEEEAAYDIVSASGRCCSFTPGGRFELKNHDVEAELGQYVITSIQHSASEASYGASTGGTDYANAFTCIPASVTYRPHRLTPRSLVRGPQTAMVVGPAGEEIYVDKYGRVKVQFHWDRYGKKDENSSCWIRVSEQWAGKNWGFVAHPRIGQEVVVDFLEGDPDRPLITGRVYNAEQMPPYGLPGSKTQSGIKSRSSKGGDSANFNEIRFEDLKGSEQLFIHAEKNQDIEVENDETHWVGHNRTKTIDNDESAHIKNNRTKVVGNDEQTTIGNDRNEKVGNDETIQIDNNRRKTISGNENVRVDKNRSESVGQDEDLVVEGSRNKRVDKDEKIKVGQSRTTSIGKDEGVDVTGGRSVSVGKNDSLNVAKALVVEAGDSIILKTGSASIEMKKNGDILINGKNLALEGSGKINVKAASDVKIKGSKIGEN